MPRGSLASRSRRCFGSQQAKANMPRSQLTASRPVQAERAQHDGRVAGGLEVLPLGHQALAAGRRKL